MDAKTYMASQEEIAGLKTLLSDARAKMKETMAKREYDSNRNWAQAVSRLENEISAKTRLMNR